MVEKLLGTGCHHVPSCTNNQLCPSAGTLVCPASSDLPANPRAAGQSQAHQLVLERMHPGVTVYVPIRSVQPSRDYWELCCKVIRSYTFCATLSRLLGIVLQSYTFLYAPVQQSRDSCELCCKVIRSYTFRATPLAILVDCVAKLYVPIRSNKIPTTFLQVILNVLSESYTFLYVPVPFCPRSCG